MFINKTLNYLSRIGYAIAIASILFLPRTASAQRTMEGQYKDYGRILGVAAVGACGEDTRRLFRNAEENIIMAVQLSFLTRGFERSGLRKEEAWKLIGRAYKDRIDSLYAEAFEEIEESENYEMIIRDGQITRDEVANFIRNDFRPFYACIEAEPTYEVNVLDYINRVTKNLNEAAKRRANQRREKARRQRERINFAMQMIQIVDSILTPPSITAQPIQSKPIESNPNRFSSNASENYILRQRLKELQIERINGWASSPIDIDTSTPDW